MTNAQQMAAATQEFLKRCQLQGSEVHAYSQVWNWLEELKTQTTTQEVPPQTGKGP